MSDPAKKSARKSVPGRPFTGAGDPRNGRGPAKGAPNAGRPRDEFKAEMQALASAPATVSRLRALLTDENTDPETFLRAAAFAADRGYGKPTQAVDVTSDGKGLQSFTLGIGTA